MRKTILSLALMLTTSVVAGEYKQPYHIDVYGGLNIFDDASYLKNSSLLGASIAIYERERQSYALQFGMEHLRGVEYEGIVLDTDIDRYYLNMIVDGEEELHITPYILLGGGYEQLNRVYEGYKDTVSQGFIDAGLGFKYRLNDYLNITLEGKAIGKVESESVDYASTLGFDFMFGGKHKQEKSVIHALDTQKVEKRMPQAVRLKPLPKVTKKAKAKKWITPEVVEAMFSKKKKVLKDTSDTRMEDSLQALKAQMAEQEARMAKKIARLERQLAQKSATKLIESKRQKEQKQLALLKKRAQIAHAKKMKEAAKRLAKLKAKKQAKALAKKRRLEKIRVAKIKAAKKLAAKKARIKKEKELAEYKRLQALQQKKEQEAAKLAEMKAQQEHTDKLFIRNGMVVFAD